MSQENLVLVTGASGFLASHIIKILQEQGYRVRGTVRSVKDKKKTEPLMRLVENPKHELELCEADLVDEQCWLNAVKGCTYVIHTASPVPSYIPEDENECIGPAVSGVLNVFKACVTDDSIVKRVVLTSSLAAIAGDEYKQGYTYTESDWGNPDTASPYTKSKILAERAAWNFIEERKKGNLKTFELAVINPSFIIGPIVHGTYSASMEPFKRIIEREMPLLPDIAIPICDVTDTALAHVKALTLDEAVSHRHLITSTNEGHSIQFYALIIEEELKNKGYNIPTHVAPNCLIKLFGIFSKTVRVVIPFLGKRSNFSNDRFIQVLGIQPTDYKKSVLDMTYDLIEKGYVKKRYTNK